MPEGLSLQNKNQIAAFRRKSSAIFQITDFLKKEFQIPIQEAAEQAKGLLLHVSRADRICHRCNTRQSEQEVTHCPKCKALNLNWAA